MKSENLDISLLLDFYGEMLTFRQREMLELYYDDDLSLSEISEHAGITRQGVRDAVKRAEAQLFELEDKIGMVRRFGRVKSLIGDIRTNADLISKENRRGCYSNDIGKAADRILALASELELE